MTTMWRSVCDLSQDGTPFGQFDTLSDLLALRGREQPDLECFSFVQWNGAGRASITCRELHDRARSVAGMLQRYVSPGDRVLLLYPPSLEFIVSFFGCIYAGAVAVPLVPPHPSRAEYGWARLNAVYGSAKPAAILANAAVSKSLASLVAADREWDGVPFCDIESTSSDLSADNWRSAEVRPDDLAFLQYTSGSTGSPKGVMLTHGNLLHNLDLIQQSFELGRGCRGVSWLPFHHDMGLIGGVLSTLYSGMQSTFFSPMDFVQQPLRWLQMISELRAEVSGAPNFAYAECVRRISDGQRSGLDLSSWRVAFCGAEPIDPNTLDAFAQSFASCGFRREAFRPCYGLAEATLLVSACRPSDMPLVVREVGSGQATNGSSVGQRMSCGRPAGDQQVIVVDPASRQLCPAMQVGEIWVSGPSVARGYWGRPDETAKAFGAFLASGEGPFLRTGDLGCLVDGQLFIAGRCKDLIIVDGKNHYPEDMEKTVEECEASRQLSRSAAFSIEVNHMERVVIAAEVHRALYTRLKSLNGVSTEAGFAVCQNLTREIRVAISERHDLRVHEVALVLPASLPRTSSGKIRRDECRRRFLTGELERVV